MVNTVWIVRVYQSAMIQVQRRYDSWKDSIYKILYIGLNCFLLMANRNIGHFCLVINKLCIFAKIKDLEVQKFRTKSAEYSREDAIMTGMRDAQYLCMDPSYDNPDRVYSLVTYLKKDYVMGGKNWGVSIVFFDTIEEKIAFDNVGVNHYLNELSSCKTANAMQICLN